ncbi:hypothetical protein BV87_16275 [Sphingobium yanoikuyae]|nr:hypothetical protein BV87_16275 [Sphingobium yanoikuyae]
MLWRGNRLDYRRRGEAFVVNVIVQLYRGAIGLIFILGVIASVAFFASYGATYGLASAIVIILSTILLTGISAVLLSINDHLAALREKN